VRWESMGEKMGMGSAGRSEWLTTSYRKEGGWKQAQLGKECAIIIIQAPNSTIRHSSIFFFIFFFSILAAGHYSQ